jgi:hypothetical protein
MFLPFSHEIPPALITAFLHLFFQILKVLLLLPAHPQRAPVCIPPQSDMFLTRYKNELRTLVFQKPCFGMKSRISLYLLVKRD